MYRTKIKNNKWIVYITVEDVNLCASCEALLLHYIHAKEMYIRFQRMATTSQLLFVHPSNCIWYLCMG